MADEEETRTKNKIYVSAAFLGHLLYVGQRNVARTPVMLKAGILLLHTAFILYIIGFVSPHWVQGEKRQYRHDVRGNRLAEDSRSAEGNATLVYQENDTHFGVWEECVIVEGDSTCTIFTEDVDSVVLMFGCVAVFILFGLCCWACASCVRKPRKGRYFFIVISAVIGGIFGLVSLILFMAVQGIRQYSWAFALFLSGCILELSAAAVFLWGIRQATAQGVFSGTVPEGIDTEGNPTGTMPTIIVTGPTPTRTDQPRAMHVIHKAARRKAGAGRGGQDEDHVDSITLDMVSPVPSMPRTGKRRKRRRGRKRNRATGGMDETAVESLARRVAKHHMTYVDMVVPTPPPRPPAHTKPNVSAADPSQPLILAASPRASDVDPNERSASGYMDLTAIIPKVVPIHRRCEDFERHPHGELRGPRNSAFRRSGLKGEPKKPQHGPIRLTVDVHQPDSFDDLFQARREEDPTSKHSPCSSPTQPEGGEALQRLPSFQPHSTPPSHRSLLDRTVEARPKRGPVPQPPFLGSQDPEVPATASERSGGARKKERSQDEAHYLRYSPDTYYQTRSSRYSSREESSSN